MKQSDNNEKLDQRCLEEVLSLSNEERHGANDRSCINSQN